MLSAFAAYNARSKNIPGRKEEKKEGKKKGTKEGRKEGRKERRKEGKKEGLKMLRKSLPLRASGHVRKRKKNTVAILAQGTSWADAISQAFFFTCRGSIPAARILSAVEENEALCGRVRGRMADR